MALAAFFISILELLYQIRPYLNRKLFRLTPLESWNFKVPAEAQEDTVEEYSPECLCSSDLGEWRRWRGAVNYGRRRGRPRKKCGNAFRLVRT